MCDSRWQLGRKRRRLPEPPWIEYKGKNEKKRPPARNGKGRSSIGSGSVMPCAVWKGKGLGDRKSITGSAEPLEPVLTPSLTPWDGANMSGPGKGTHESPAWAGDLWSTSPMDHQQLAARMVCSWGLVKVYQWTRQSTYICPPTPHVIEAFNHKVNHDSHKELGTQECAVLQYARMLQYVSYCNNERYRDHIAPVVKAFWDEVAQPFGSRALHNLDLSHTVGKVMCPNRVAKIPDYGVWDYIVLICTPFFKGIESHSQYEIRQCQREEERGCVDALGDHCSPSHDPEEEPKSKKINPVHLNPAGHIVNLDTIGM